MAAVCKGTTLTLVDGGTPIATSTLWSVDGTPSGGTHQFQYDFTTVGTHVITLANVYGTCPQSVSKSVLVNALPVVPAFTTNIHGVCGAPVLVDFADQSPPGGIALWSWQINFNDGSNLPLTSQSTTGGTFSHLFTANGQYEVGLQITNAAGCVSGHTELLNIAPPTVSIYEVTPTSASFTCSQPITKTLAINPPAAALQSWRWDFGDGTSSTDVQPTHTWTQPGQYVAALHWTDVNGCSGVSNNILLLISPPLNLDFTTSPTTVCAGVTVNFSSPSLVAANAVSTTWSFGDGASTSQGNHIYTTPGTYTVSLTATNAGGCTTTMTKPNYITVLQPPGQYNGYTTTCDGPRRIVTFQYAQSGATSIHWDFGDGTSQTTAGNVSAVQHTYPQTGIYYLNVNATNGTCNNPNSDVVRVLAKQNPVLSASASKVCSQGSLQVTLKMERNPREINSGYYDDYTPSFFYSDGTPYTGSVVFTNPYNAYQGGAFGWTLTGFQQGKSGLYVSTQSFGFNCSDVSNVLPLTIQGQATAGLTVVADDQCFQTAVQLGDASTVGTNNAIVNWAWDFGDGLTQTNKTGGGVSHFYAHPGSYTARLTIQDVGGCVSTSGSGVANVQVNGPEANYSYSPARVLMGNTVSFFNNTNTAGAFSTTYHWDFGDGTSSNAVNPTHIYPNPGTYTVVLTASGNSPTTCVTSGSQKIVVNYFNPNFQIASLYVSNGHCPPVLAQFTNTSVNYSSVAWDFGDGTSAGNVNYPSHVYTQPGGYRVILSVSGSGGLVTQYMDSIYVRQPSASLSAQLPAVCVNQPEQYQAKAKGALHFVFDYGDGAISNGLDSGVSHAYTQSGDYVAQLVVTDTVGCSVAAVPSAAVRVNALPTIAVSPADPHACLGSGVLLTASGASTYSWTPATGLDNPLGSAPVASPLVNTQYLVTGIDNNGCQGQSTVDLKVVTPQTILVSPDSTGICLGDSLVLHAKGTDVVAWIGDVDGLGALGSADPVAKPPQTVHYQVVGSDAYSCFSDTAAVTVTVLPLPTVNGGGGVEVLDGAPVSLLATGSSDIVRWEWSPAVYLSCTDCEQPVCTPKKPEVYQVLVTNEVGLSCAGFGFGEAALYRGECPHPGGVYPPTVMDIMTGLISLGSGRWIILLFMTGGG